MSEPKKFMLPDLLDGTARGAEAESFKTLSLLFKKVIPLADSFENESIQIEPKNDDDADWINALVSYVEKFQSTVQLFRAYGFYLQEKGRNYIFSKALVEEMRKVSLDISSSFLPSRFSGYLELPEKDLTENCNNKRVFVQIYQDQKLVKYTNIIYVTDTGKATVLSIELLPNEKVTEAIERLKSLIGNNDREEMTLRYKFLLNCILFITAQGADFTFKKNEFPKKASKLRYAKEHFTPKNWILVGKDFHSKHLPRGPLNCGMFSVTGHYRWQPCGPKMSQHKLIWIDSFVKGITKEVSEVVYARV